ncbi:hypothetical protein CU098_011647 [Rhizopus stolonifer]|uniref:F-box domain-containing protein n=1 Tax=Rhizopus stolonifer TaxID=4846 RepID=A0A367KLX5_RHIST|nr:hypothetical protein CU098_011647 [Rhizopus stolonifer]
MPYWNCLPPELLGKIFVYLDSTSAIQCQLTCRSWTRASQLATYCKVALRNTDQIASFVHTITNSSFLGNHVKKLNINNDFDTISSNVSYFTDLINYCPNLEELTVLCTYQLFWERLLRELEEGNLKHLDTLQYPTYSREIESYSRVVLTMRSVIKQAIICDSLSSGETHFYTDSFNMLISRLGEFKRIERLKVRNHTNISLRELGEMLDIRSRLEVLNIFICPDEPLIASTSCKKQDQPKQIETVTKLCLSLPLCSEDIFVYIMSKFPNVKHLSIDEPFCTEPAELEDGYRPMISPEVLKAFTAYLKAMKSFYINDLYPQNINEVIDFWLAHLVEGRLYVSLTFESEFIGDTLDRISLVPDSTGVPEVSLTSQIGDFNLNYLHVIRHVGSKITRLEMEDETYGLPVFVFDNERFKNAVHGYYLDDIFDSCHNMKELTLTGMTMIAFSPEPKVNKSIETLKLLGGEWYMSAVFQLSNRLPALKHVEVYNSIIDENMSIIIDMANTSFESLSLGSEFSDYDNYFYLKLSSVKGDEYYRCSETEISASNEATYNKWVKSLTVLTVYIRCKSLYKLEMRTHGFNNWYTISSP